MKRSQSSPRKQFKKQGMTIMTGAQVEKLDTGGQGRESDHQKFKGGNSET